MESPTTQARVESEQYYHPERVDYWLSHWQELRELAAPTAPSVTYDGSLSQHTPGRRPGDPTRYVDVQADIERAWCRLAIWSIEWTCIKTVMDGYPLREMARTYRLHSDTVYDAYHRATLEMAQQLGWKG